ncbi:MAG TPA: type I-U CRISPR-associated helicase/endonuclease Cas3 [Bacillota bacterium]|nr:type I-U CRISPR-associated helicase/endonuclease Cas3 [Bacillota bacterium]
MGFGAFFESLWNHTPFPWQAMLADRVAQGTWPQALDLPTASGKTACIDIAIYALAVQAAHTFKDRTAPRRIWFVVDRRIVVDEAFIRAQAIAAKLAEARTGPLKDIADRLRELSGTDRPLAVARLRGGILQDNGWARIPSQPAVITSTVDQLGSRLLFRGYGHSPLAAPIFAGLAANDSLIILDEAHCAVPLLQTLRAVERLRGPQWAETPLITPFAFVLMSATPPTDISGNAVFPGVERKRALDHSELHRRLHTSKLAELVEVRGRQADAGDGPAGGDPLVAEAARRAAKYLDMGKQRVAVMVNRVATADRVADRLQEILKDRADVVLLTSRIRPFERDDLVQRFTPYLQAREPQVLERPVVVVATQCLEVGADFSFEALVTECASLDAIRQRFGRLARVGSTEPAPAAIVVRNGDIESDEPDPVYGSALADTWKWLREQADPGTDGRLVMEFGIEALEAKLPEAEQLSHLLKPTESAPSLLPAHLDLLCQTAPPAYPQPDIALYLHGRPGAPEASVVWRSDLHQDASRSWAEIVGLCPPVSGEMLQVPLWRLKAWLTGEPRVDDSAEVEGTGEEQPVERDHIRPCLVWRGRDRSVVVRKTEQLAPGDVVVVPSSYGVAGLGHATRVSFLGVDALDLWEPARNMAAQPPAVRLNRAVLGAWLGCLPLKECLGLAETPTLKRQELEDAIDAVLAYEPDCGESPAAPPAWWLELLRAARNGRMTAHPAGGVILFGRKSTASHAAPEVDLFADDDDLTSASDREVALSEHADSVKDVAAKLAPRCLPADFHDVIQQAAEWHDAGKLDDRFQLMLHQGDELAAAEATAPLAKSASFPASPPLRHKIRLASGLPPNYRHEMLSAELAQRFAGLPQGSYHADLVLHLIASHHGHARALAPVCLDSDPVAVSGRLAGVPIVFDRATRAASVPAHRVDSGLTDRFWRLNRRYGWWGLAYLEAIMRLADWYGSSFTIQRPEELEEGP